MQTSDVKDACMQSILGHLFELIDTQKCSQAVIDYVFGIVHNLVTYSNFEETDENDKKISRLPVHIVLEQLQMNSTNQKGW
jgi:hypothetical protein